MKKALAIVLTFIFCFGILSFAFASEDEATVPEGFTGIYSAEDLDNIRNNLSGKYILMNDIDLSLYGNWDPIGTSETPFTGELDGNGYAIKNMTINEEYSGADTVDFGLFGWMNQSTLSNLIVRNSEINIKYVGNDSSKCRFGTVAGFSNQSKISNCVVSGNIVVEGFAKAEIGGISGKSKTTICTLCGNYSDINVIINSTAVQTDVGGISGYASSGEKKCFNYGDISVNGTDISESCVVKIGGIDGNGSENIGLINSYNRGKISVGFSNPNTYIGGLSGNSYIIKSCYNSGAVCVPDNFNGFAAAVSGSINDNLIGYGEGRIIKDSYYSDNKLLPAYDGTAVPDSFDETPFENVRFLNDAEMRTQSSFVGFDFDTVWIMEENGYPILRNTPELFDNTEKPIITTTSSSTETITVPVIIESTTILATETTTVVSESTTEPISTITEPSVFETTESSTEPNKPSEECWLIKLLKMLLCNICNFVLFIVSLF